MLILASSSPRRRDLLSLLGIDFQVLASDVDENVLPGESPKEYVLRLAQEKAQSIVKLVGAGQVIIAADTAVVDGNQILGKPVNNEDALRMLRSLRARTHQVLTGLAVWDPEAQEEHMDLSMTEVQMRPFLEAEMEAYVASGDPLDKAGAYAIQNSRFNPVQRITGCYSNVVGLPLCHLSDILLQSGLNIPIMATRGCRSALEYNCQLVDKIQAPRKVDFSRNKDNKSIRD